MESDYPDLYTQYSKIHNNAEMNNSSGGDVQYQNSDIKPTESARDENYRHNNVNIEDQKAADITREIDERFNNDMSNQQDMEDTVMKEEPKADNDSKATEENGTEEQTETTESSKDPEESEHIPAPPSEPAQPEENWEKDKKEETEIETNETQASVIETEDTEKDVCRVCMKPGLLISIFDTDNPVSVCQKVMSCAAVQIAKKDGLPNLICEICMSDLEVAYNFKKRCEESDIALRAKLGLKAKTIVKTEFVLIDCDNEPVVSDDNKRYRSDSGADYSDQESDDPSYGAKKKKKKTKKKSKKAPSKPKTKPKTKKMEKVEPKKVKEKPKEKPKIEEKRPERNLKRKATAPAAPSKAESDDDVIIVSKKLPLPKIKKMEIPVNRYPCTFCEKTFPYPSVLKLHLVTHTKEKAHKCSLCTMAFMYSKDLYSHYKEAHPNEYGKVDENGKYTCTTCKKSFTQLKHLKVHEAVHVRDKKYKCELCPQRFTNMTSLNLHVKMDHPDNNKPYKCKMCDKAFKQQVTLEKHLENHKAVRPLEKIEEKRPTSTKDLFKSIAPLTTTYWSDSFSD